MASLADNLIPPYYAAIIENELQQNDNAPLSAADRLVTDAVRRPGFLGLETARGTDGRPLTVAYWRELADAEGWAAGTQEMPAKKFPLEIRKVANAADNEAHELYTVGDDSKVAWRYT